MIKVVVLQQVQQLKDRLQAIPAKYFVWLPLFVRDSRHAFRFAHFRVVEVYAWPYAFCNLLQAPFQINCHKLCDRLKEALSWRSARSIVLCWPIQECRLETKMDHLGAIYAKRCCNYFWRLSKPLRFVKSEQRFEEWASMSANTEAYGRYKG